MTTLDTALTALADERRRRLLVAFLDRDPRTEGGVRVPEDLHDRDGTTGPSVAEMYHVHVPRLEDAGFVRWNGDDHTAVEGPKFDELRPLIEVLCDHADELPGEWP